MDYVTRQFIVLAKKLRKELRKALSDVQSALQKQTDAIRQHYATAKQTQDAQPPIKIIAELHTPEDVEGRHAANDDRHYRLQWWQTVGTWLAFLAVVIYAWLTYLQLKDFDASVGINQIIARQGRIQAAAAHTAVANQQKSFEIDQRPYMVVDFPPHFITSPAADVPVQANVTMRNIGRTPARYYIMNAKLLRFEPSKDPGGLIRIRHFMDNTFAALEHKDAAGRKEVEEVGAEVDMAPTGSIFITCPTDKESAVIVSAKDFPRIATGGVSLFYVGIISYTDSFKTSYVTEFCSLYFGTDPRTWHACDNHNTIK